MFIGESLRLDQYGSVMSLVREAKGQGVATACSILFGSRARNQGRRDSDADIVMLYEFPREDSYLKNPHLLYVKEFGHAFVTRGDLDVFMYNLGRLRQGGIGDPRIMPIESGVQGLVRDGRVIYGREPLFQGIPFLEYLRGYMALSS